MGYSARQDAFRTLERIQEKMRQHGATGQNLIVKNGKEVGFWEIGRENADGAITGSVIVFTSAPYIGKYGAETREGRKVGSFRISPDGIVERFPLVGTRV